MSSPAAMAPGLVVLVLALLLGLQPVTTDLYLPALPALTQGFGAPMGQAQLTLTALLLAFGLSQLVWGPLSDRIGRRPILLWGLGAYVLASIAAALAPSMIQLIVWRTVQGAAMGAAVMCARALVRDLYPPLEGARVMSKGLSGLGVIACLAAPLGGVISDAFGWRIALLALAVAGAATLALIAWRFEETLALRNPQALQPRTLLRTWAEIVRHPTFLSYALLATASYCGLFTFLAASSFVLIGLLGLSKTAYGAVMFFNSFVYIIGTLGCRRLLPRLGVRRTVWTAAFCTLLAGVLLAGLYLAGVRSLWAIVLPSWLYMLGHGVHQPCGQSGAVGPFPHAAGAASAMSGFLMMVGAFGTGAWLGLTLRTGPDASAWPLVMGMAAWCLVVATIAWTLVQRYGDGREGPPADGVMTTAARWLALTGPTASGKTAAALAIAARWPVEIVSVDSALVYRGMDIGTAKPDAAERAAAPHHLIDIRDPLENYSAAEFARDALALLHQIHARGRIALLAGGTMLYFKALFEGLDDLPPTDPAVRAAVAAEANEKGWPAMHAELARVDPVVAERLSPNDAQRVSRALEVFRASGRPLSAWQRGQARTDWPMEHGALLSLEPTDRAWLHARIALRFDAMLDAGFLDEVRTLRARGDLTPELASMRCVGYRQAWEALDSGDLAGLRDKGIFATRQLAKRQLTWLRGMDNRRLIACDVPDALDRVLAQAHAVLGPA